MNGIDFKSDKLGTLLDCQNHWVLPFLTTKADWDGFLCELDGWPSGLDSHLLERFAYHELGIGVDDLFKRRKIRFNSSCHRDISKEDDPVIRKAIIEIICCRAYDRVRPEHGDHEVIGKPGIQRVYVKQMTPPVRLHYYFEDEEVVYSLYSNNDHRRGL